MKMTTLSTLLITAWTLVACSTETPADSNANSAATNSTETARVDVAPQTAEISVIFKDGTNDQNRGDKVGPVRVHGTMTSSTSGEVILYESEGRNSSEVARTKLVNRTFDFGELELGRGFFKSATTAKPTLRISSSTPMSPTSTSNSNQAG